MRPWYWDRYNLLVQKDGDGGDTAQWNSISDFSRDQQSSLVIAMGVYKLFEPLKRMFWQHVKRLGFYQNKDYASPEHWGYYIRAFGWRWLYWYLYLGDLFMLLNVYIRLHKAKDPNDVGDDLNLSLALLQAHLSMPTFISKYALELYKKRPFGVQYAFDWYFREETGANPFNELYAPIIERYLK